MSDLIRLTAAETAAAVAAGETSAVDVPRPTWPGSRRSTRRVHAFLHVDADGAREAARRVDARRGAGEQLGPLAGVPIALKDVLATEGVPTTCGSRILEGWRPPYDATVVAPAARGRRGDARQDEHGRVRDGQLDRALGLRPDAQPVGPRPHPGRLRRRSAAAVAAFEAPLAVGTDTGGSIRQPAAVTGTVGVKPTYGGVSRYGLVALRLVAGPGRALRAHRARRRAAARGHRRPRPARLDLHRRTGARRGRRRPARRT